MLIGKHRFTSMLLMVIISIISMLATLPAFAVAQCGTFEMVPMPGRVTQIVPFPDGTATAIGSSEENASVQVLRYFDGSTWSEQALPSETDGFIFGSAGGTPDGDAWFAGTRGVSVYEIDIIMMRVKQGIKDRIDIIRYPSSINTPGAPIDISGSSFDNVWAVTASGDTLSFDGSSWNTMDVPSVFIDQHLDPKGIYTTSADNVWIAGYGSVGKGTDKGFIQHWDGQNWQVVPTSYSENIYTNFFYDIDGSSPTDIWVVGHGIGTTNWESISLHWDGNAWTKRPDQPTDFPIGRVMAMAPNNAWILPKQGNGMHYWNGSTWSQASDFIFPEEAVSISVRDVEKAGDCDAWVVGDYHDGIAYHPWAARLVPGDVPNEVTDIFVANTEVSRIKESRKAYSGLATVTILNANSIPVSGAEVSGSFSGPSSESLVVTTGSDGKAIFSSDVVSRPSGDWCFIVTNVVAAESSYNTNLNIKASACENVSDGGSGGKGNGKGKK